MLISPAKNSADDFLRIKKAGYDYSCGYYSQNCFVDDLRLVLTRRENAANRSYSELILVNIKNGTEKVIYAENSNGIDHIVYKNTVYYVKNSVCLCSLDVDTFDGKDIYTCETAIVQPHITADGRYISWFDAEGKIPTQTCRRIDLQTGEVEIMVKYGFEPPFYVANHFMICPTDPDVIFFAHEGDTTYITNRLWLAEKGKKPYNLAKQRLDGNGNLIDCIGHECWAPDGKGLYFVKYACSPEPPCGIGYIDIKTKTPKILFSKYKYWHVCVSPNGKYLTADTGPNDLDKRDMGKSTVCLINIDNKTEKVIANIGNGRSHPYHPHPQFSPSSKKICFNDLTEDGLCVGIIEI